MAIQFPVIARATDLQSIITAVNQIKQIVDILTNQFAEEVHWVERSRVTRIIRVTNPQNPENWVDVERIMKITFQNLVTRELLVWDYLAGTHAAET